MKTSLAEQDNNTKLILQTIAVGLAPIAAQMLEERKRAGRKVWKNLDSPGECL